MKQRSFLMLLLVGLLSVVLAACAGGSDKYSNVLFYVFYYFPIFELFYKHKYYDESFIFNESV